jgi:hypothetical protein
MISTDVDIDYHSFADYPYSHDEAFKGDLPKIGQQR